MIKRIILSLMVLIDVACMRPSDPANPIVGPSVDNSGGYSIIKTVRTTGVAQGIAIYDTVAYIAQGETGVSIYSINNPQNPVYLSEKGSDVIPPPESEEAIRGYNSNLIVKYGYLFIAAGNFGLTGIDARDPLYPFTFLSNSNPKPVKDLVLYRKYIFTAVSEAGFATVNISAIANPLIGHNTRTPGYANALDISFDSSSLLIACGEAGFAMFTISNITSENSACSLTAYIDLPGYSKDVATHKTKSIAYVACHDSGIAVVDYSKLSSLTKMSTYKTSGYTDYLCVDGNMLYASNSRKGILAINMENPSSPKLAGTIAIESPAGIAVYGNYILVTDKNSGFVVIKKP